MRRSKNVQQMREFFVAGINYNDKPHKATMQRLNPPMGVRCHLVEQTILLECHYVFTCRNRIKQILANVCSSFVYTCEIAMERDGSFRSSK